MSNIGYYVVEERTGDVWRSAGIWYSDGELVVRVSSYTKPALFRVQTGEPLQDAFARSFGLRDEIGPRLRIVRTTLKPGQYYHRMARPVESHYGKSHLTLPDRHQLRDEVTANQGHLRTLIDMLEKILLVVYPAPDNLNAYGYEIRNLLILACAECETQWRSILQANGYKRKNNHYTTADFVRLEPAMMLRDYAVGLTRYPMFQAVSPFRNWRLNGKPTQDLDWYDAYNSTKHDRISNLKDSTLLNATTALIACWIMLVSQFGGPVLGDPQHLRDYFTVVKQPNWELSDTYLFHVNDQHHRKWCATEYDFLGQ